MSEIKLKKKTFFSSLLIVCLLSVLFSGIIFSRAQSDITITEGSFRENTSYNMWLDESTYYVKDGSTGQVVSSTNASYLLIAIFSEMGANGGSVQLSEGDFTLTNNVTIPQYGVLIGQGQETTHIFLSGHTTITCSSWTHVSRLTIDGSSQSGNHPALYAYSQSNVMISNVRLTSTTSTGLWLESSSYCTITSSHFDNTLYHGCYLQTSSNNLISNCFFYSNAQNGLSIAFGSDLNVISNCQGFNNTWHGFHVDQYSSSNAIENCVSRYNDDGIQISLSNGNKITNCELTDNNSLGLYLNNANYTSVSNTNMFRNGQVYSGYSEVLLGTDTTGGAYNNFLYGIRTISTNQNYGINESIGDYNIIMSCSSIDAGTSNIYYSGSHTAIIGSYNGTTYIDFLAIQNIDFSQYQLVNGVFHKGSTAPSNPVEGQYFYDTDDHTLYVYNSTAWTGILGEGGVVDHGALTGLADDDHSQYLLADGTRDMSGNLNMSQNEILFPVIHNTDTAPSNPVVGQMYYDTGDNVLYVWNNTAWHEMCEVPADDFEASILFEYGAEAGPLGDYWDTLYADGVTYGLAQINDTYSRTGEHSIYLYQKAPVKTDNERRVHLRMEGANLQQTEGYYSWWIYFDAQMAEDMLSWGTTLGGWQLWFGPENEKLYRWWTGGRFGITPESRKFAFNYRWGDLGDSIIFSADAVATEQSIGTSYYVDDYLDEWIHLQVYWNIDDSDGVVMAWFNNDLVANLTSLITDPRGYAEWYDDPVDGGLCAFHVTMCNGPYPQVGLELYQDTISNENWLWADDIVIATKKVPEDYAP